MNMQSYNLVAFELAMRELSNATATTIVVSTHGNGKKELIEGRNARTFDNNFSYNVRRWNSEVAVIFGYYEELSKQHHNVNLRGASTLNPRAWKFASNCENN